MAWSSDTSIPVDHLAIASIPSAIRDVKLGMESGAVTMTNKVMVAPVVYGFVGVPVTSNAVTYVLNTAALTGVVKIVALTYAASTSGLAVVTPAGTIHQITNGAELVAVTEFSMARTAIVGGNVVLKNYISTEVARIQVANSAASTILSVLLATVSTGNLDQGSVQIGAAAVTDTLRCASVLCFGKDHASNPGQIILRPAAYSTTPATAAITGVIDASAARVINLKAPLEDQDASTKKYQDDVVGTDAEGGYRYRMIDGVSTKVYTKYFTGTTAAGATTTKAHGITNGLTKILSLTVSVFYDTSAVQYVIHSSLFQTYFDDTNAYIGGVASACQSNAYTMQIDYIL